MSGLNLQAVIVLGAGGHAKVLIEALLQSGKVIAGIADPDTALFGIKILGVLVLGGDDVVDKFPPSEVQLVNGLGSVGLPIIRQQLYERFKSLGYNFATVVHPSAVVASDVVLNKLELQRIRKHLGAFHCRLISISISVNAMHLIERYTGDWTEFVNTPMIPSEIEKSRKLIIRQKNKSGEVAFFN